jgi:hypothetical protein
MINYLTSFLERFVTWTNFGRTTFFFVLPFTLWAVSKLIRDLSALRGAALRKNEQPHVPIGNVRL